MYFSINSCKKKEDDNVAPVKSTETLQAEITANYAEIVYRNYLDAFTKAAELDQKLRTFVATPGVQNFEAAKTAWKEARIVYLQTEAFRFYEGPIDNAEGPEGRLNAWPLDEVFIDYVKGNPSSGIINDTINYPVITKALLKELNETDGNGGEAEKNISTGYHAIEFLLWGQDTSANAPGQRPYTDFVNGGTASNQIRRGIFLLTVSEILLEDLQYLIDQWAPTNGRYRIDFTGVKDLSSIKKILLGIGSLSWGEMGSERLAPAYNELSQEEEHSCFSDNTHNDFIYDQLGIENVYLGRYRNLDGSITDGPGLDELVQRNDATLDAEMKSILEATKLSVQALQAPFDQEILKTEGRKRIQNVLVNLEKQSKEVSKIAQHLGITLELE